MFMRARRDRQQRLRVAAVVPGRRIDERAPAGVVEALQLGEALLGVVEDVVRVLLRTPARRPGEDVLVDVREAELLGGAIGPRSVWITAAVLSSL